MSAPDVLVTYVEAALRLARLDPSEESRRAIEANLALLLERAAEFERDPPPGLDPAALLRL